MAFLKLFILLALPYTCVSKRGLRYTNTWAVKIDGDITTVKNIAQRNGFNYKMKVFFYSPKTSEGDMIYTSGLSQLFKGQLALTQG